MTLVPRHCAGISGYEETGITEGVDPLQPVIQEKAAHPQPVLGWVGSQEIDVPMRFGRAMNVGPLPESHPPFRMPTVVSQDGTDHSIKGFVVIAGSGRDPGAGTRQIVTDPKPPLMGELIAHLG